MSEPDATIAKLQKQIRVLQKKLERSEWHRVDLENQHDRDQHLYRRLQSDLEAAKREAQIEAALERIRAQSLAMAHSSELVATSAVFHEQLLALGVPTEFSYVWLPDEAAGRHQFWATWTEEEGDEPVHRSRAFTYDLDKSEPYTAACFTAWESDDPLWVDFIPPDEVANFFSTWAELLAGAESLRAEHFPDGIYYAEGYMQYGCFGINIRREPTDEERDIIRRFSVEFERAYTRYLDLERAEAQAREAEIEAALEKVRSRSLAVASTDEFGEVVTVVFEKLSELGIPAYSVTMPLLRDDTDAWDVYGCGLSDEGLTTLNFKLPYFPNPITDDILAAKRTSTNGYLSTIYSPEDKDAYYDYALTQTELRNLPDDVKETIRRRDPYAVCVAYAPRSMIIANDFEGNELTEAQAEILQRFSRVLEQAYTRFLDLQRAEEQAREAEIEAALERVRSRTMAMQSSDELPEAANLLFEQVKSLGMPAWSAGYCIWDDDKQGVTQWVSTEGERLPSFWTPVTEDPTFIHMREAHERGETLYVEEVEGEDLAEHYRYMSDLPVVGDLITALGEAGHPLPTYQINHCAYFSHGFLLFITYEPVPEAHDVFRRFAGVFDQTYTRYLDLERAEARARETQIEAALERVRSRALAMTTSDELLDVIQRIHQEYAGLGLPCEVFWQTRYRPEGYHKAVTGVGGERVSAIMELPRDFSMVPELAAWERGTETIGVFPFDAEAAAAYVHHMNTKGDFLKVDPEGITPEVARELGGLTFVQARTTHGEIGYALWGEAEPTEEAKDVLVRFASTFDLAYRRFLDLQEAEARSRETQIEVAIERVRSKALEMTAPDDLLDVVFTIHREYAGLGFDCGAFWHTRYTPEVYQKALTSVDGQKLAAIMELPRDFASNPMLEAWERGHDKIGVFPFDADGACEYLRHMIAKGKYDKVDPEAFTEEMIRENSGWTFVQARTSHGEIGYSLWGETEPTDEAKRVLVRFATAFDLAYRRFEDLQQAEADHQALLEEKAITEQALAELRAAQARLVQSEKMASLGALTAGIAHEIKNPLNFVTNFASLSRELLDELPGVADDEERDEILGDLRQNAAKIEAHGRRADAIVRSMMEHARSGTGERRAVGLNKLVEEHAGHALHAVKVRHPGFEAALGFRLGPDVGDVDLVPQEIGRVLVNLVDNGFDAARLRALTEPNGYAPAVTVTTRRTDGGVEIRVEDNGTGMPEAVRARVFEPFFTTKPTGQGTGLGLSLSYDIVTQGHGGSLVVESTEGEGTTFALRLPAA